MKFRIVGLILIINSAILFAQALVVENVRFDQRIDGTLLVDIYYDVTDVDGDTVDIVIEASNDDGMTWDLPCTSLTGDIGIGIAQGINKHVVWDFYADNPNTSGSSYRVRVTAHEIVTDIDGNRYRYVTIGNQVWMAENLKTTHYRNGDEIPNVTDDMAWSTLSTGAYRNYDNNEDSVDTYGRLYNWHSLNDSRNIAPEGWHVPTDEEWKELEMALGMNQEAADGTGLRGAGIGGKLKETGTAHWESPNTGATNESGFSALPGGYCSTSGHFNNMGNEGCFWSSTESSSSAWFRALKYDFSEVNRNILDKQYGFSVRCVKDQDTLIETIETLGEADSIYQSVYDSQGRAAAVDSTIAFLNSQALVSSAGMSPDSSVYVFYENGLLGCVYNPDLDTTALSIPESGLEKQVEHHIPSGGEATPMAVILLPFAHQFGSESELYVKTLLDYCFGGSIPETQVYMNGAVNVPLIKDWLKAGPGVLFWSGHGARAPIEPGLNEYWTTLVTGESYGSKAMAEKVRDIYEQEAFFQGVMREIIIASHKSRFYLAVTPAFVSNNANFDVISGVNQNCNKSLVFACCCSSADVDLADAFLNGGADAYLGWSKTVHTNFASNIHTSFFMLAATDTCTIKEAYELVRYNVDPKSSAELVLDISDPLMMIRAQMNMAKDGTDLHGYSVGVTVNSHNGVTTVGCWTEPGLAGVCNVNVSFPGTGPRSFNCTIDEDAVITLMDASAGKMYMLQAGLVGVEGNINVKTYSSDMLYGTFSGTLGYWEQGQNPSEDPPSETVNIQNGFIKHTGLRLEL